MEQDLRERIKDLILASVLTLVGIGGFVFINPTGADISEGPGGLTWRSLPFLYSGLLLLLVGLFVGSTLYDIHLLSKGQKPRALLGDRQPVESTTLSNTRRVATVICLIGYAAGIKAFGFAMATPVLLFVMSFVLGRRNLLANLSIALIGSVLLWVLFVGILKLPMTGNVWDPLTPILNALYAMTGAR